MVGYPLFSPRGMRLGGIYTVVHWRLYPSTDTDTNGDHQNTSDWQSGRYTSYWNAVWFAIILLSILIVSWTHFCCFRLRHMIEFRSLSDLSQIIQNFSTGSFEPAALCSRSSTTLLFVNRSEIPRSICEIDCRGAAPILLRKKIWTEMLHVADMCIVPYERKPLLVASDLEYGSVTAYNLLSNELEWSIQTHVSSITTDGRDYILGVGGDGIMMFSLLNNKNLGVLIRHGDKGLGKIKLVDWCNKTASLLVAHGVNKKINLSTIQFECQYS